MAQPHQRSSDGRWAVSYRDRDGKRRCVYGRTKRECNEKYRAALTLRDRGLVPADGRTTLADFLTDWLDTTIKAQRAYNTEQSYRHLLSYPARDLGHIKLAQLTPAHIQRLYASLLDQNLAPNSIRSLHGVLTTALKTAVRWELITRNPIDAVTPPRKQAIRPMNPLSEEEAGLLFESSAGDHYHLLWRTIIQTGLRIGEATGLAWPQVDTASSRITITQTIQKRPGRSATLVPQTKTVASRRTIKISPDLARRLADAQRSQLKAGIDNPQHLVFLTTRGTPIAEHVAGKALARACRAAGLPVVTPKDLRHSCATILLTRNVHPKKVQQLLGHTTVKQTIDTYSHILPGIEGDTANEMEDIFGPSAVKHAVSTATDTG